MSRNATRVLSIILISLSLAACETLGGRSSEERSEAAVEEREAGRAGAGEEGTGARTHGVRESGEFRGSPLEDPESPLSTRVIYFDFDSSEVRAEYRDAVQAHASYLARNPDTVVTLEGHADERGSREYNLALGERRANAIRRQMVLLGASAGQIRTVSYGEERPAAEGHDESAWSQNRRVEIVY